jgi:hypothetical protein
MENESQLFHEICVISKNKPMKSDTSLNLMLLVFCAALLGFVLLSNRLHHKLQVRQLQTEQQILR